MRSKLLLVLLCSSVAACNAPSHPNEGVAAVNVPVVTTADYVMDAAAPGGVLAPGEPQKLDGWFQGLGIGYGDTVYVDGPVSDGARRQVAAIAGRYGMLVTDGAPVTAGVVGPDMVRVVVSRRRATVPGCPNWHDLAQPNYENKMMPNFGCGVNSNIAMQIADPEDLVHGREGTKVIDTNAAVKAVQLYRSQAPTGQGGLKEIKGSQ